MKQLLVLLTDKRITIKTFTKLFSLLVSAGAMAVAFTQGDIGAIAVCLALFVYILQSLL